jgi:phosphocarrier protein HPr
MLREELTVTNPKGIHARPSSMIVNTAQSVDATIRFEYNGEILAADNIMDVLSMGAEYGSVITVVVESGDASAEEAAMNRMKEIFALNFSDGS